MARSGRNRRLRLKHSAPEQPKDPDALSYQWERFGPISREFPTIFRRHWEEIALNKDAVPLDPDWNRYFEFDLLGLLNVLTVRRRGILVGYYFVVVGPHLHYLSTKWAQTDIFYLDKAYRRGWAGYRMIKEMVAGMRKLEVKVINVNLKLHFQQDRGTIEKIFLRLGFKPTDLVLTKVL